MKLPSLLQPSALAAVAAAALVAACGGGGSSSSTASGSLRVAITDAPACGYDAVNVTVEKVRVHQSATASDADSGWSEVVLNPARKLNLLDLTNGVLAELGQTELPAGSYSQLRLQLASNGTGAPYANSLVLTGSDGSEVPLDTPSAQQTGLKMNLNLTVQPNQLADLVLDFDACKSVVKRGNSGHYNLKPVVAVVPLVRNDAFVAEGHVATGIALPTTTVSLQQGGVPVKSTVPAADGRFVLYPVPAGTYDLVVSAEGRVTAVMTGVPITDTSRTFATPTGTAIDPPTGDPRTASGTVAISGSTTVPLASLRATQKVGASTVERTGANADATTGAFSLNLVAGVPVFTAYSASATSLAFTPDAANTTPSKYTVIASTDGKAPVSADADVATASVTGLTLTFAP